MPGSLRVRTAFSPARRADPARAGQAGGAPARVTRCARRRGGPCAGAGAAGVRQYESVEQLGLAGMPPGLYPCTPSRLRSWLECPRRYRMAYLDHPRPSKGPPWAHHSLGASVHNALAGWWRLPRPRRTVQAAGELLERGWIGDGYADAGQSAAHLARARAMVEGYVAGLDPDAEPAGVERTVGMKTGRIALSGRIDRLDDRPAGAPGADAGPGARGLRAEPWEGGRELVVVDYKTGRRPPADDDARTSLALAVYALAAGQVLRRPCRRVELHHLPSGQVVTWAHTADALARHLRRAEEIAAECAAADELFRAGPRAGGTDTVFPPAPGPACGWCDYRAHCREGQLAAPPRQPWDGLADPGVPQGEPGP